MTAIEQKYAGHAIRTSLYMLFDKINVLVAIFAIAMENIEPPQPESLFRIGTDVQSRMPRGTVLLLP